MSAIAKMKFALRGVTIRVLADEEHERIEDTKDYWEKTVTRFEFEGIEVMVREFFGGQKFIRIEMPAGYQWRNAPSGRKIHLDSTKENGIFAWTNEKPKERAR